MAETKAWYASKAVWGGVLVFVGGGLTAIGLEHIGQPLISLGMAIGFIGLRVAEKSIK